MIHEWAEVLVSNQARSMFLEHRLCDLIESRASVSLSSAERARVEQEIDLIERLLALYHRVVNLEQTLLDQDSKPQPTLAK